MATQRLVSAALRAGAVAAALVAAAALGFGVTSASAASLRLNNGGRMTAAPVSQVYLPIGLAGSPRAAGGSFGGGIAYWMTEPSGTASSGIVPGTRSVGVGEPSLAQNPLTGEIFMVFARSLSSGSEIVFTSWTGQSWSEPQALASSPTASAESQPVLSFGELGEAVLAWRHEEFLPTLLVRHFELMSSGPVVNHSFSDLGCPEALLRPAGGPVGLPSGISHVLTDSFSRNAYLFLADAEREQVGVVRLDLQALYQGGGFNAPPVPVSLQAATPQSTGSSEPVPTRPTEPGSLIEPWRLALTADVFAFYWIEEDRLALVLFRDGAGGRMISVPLPADGARVHAAAYHAALREFGLVDRRSLDRQVARRR